MTTNPNQGPTSSVIAIPERLREQVQDFVAQLTADDSNVSGYMMSSGLPLHGSGTRCYVYDSTDGGGLGLDVNCPDHD